MDEAIQRSVPLPHSIDSRIYLHLTPRAQYTMLLVTTAGAEEVGTAIPLGSFVYALPDRFNPTQPLSTSLFTVEPTIEFTTRLAKLLARRTGLPAYVGNSLSLVSTGLGGTVEEEMDAFRAVVDALVPLLDEYQAKGASDALLPNGTGSTTSSS